MNYELVSYESHLSYSSDYEEKAAKSNNEYGIGFWQGIIESNFSWMYEGIVVHDELSNKYVPRIRTAT